MQTPPIQTLITDARQVLNLQSISEIRATMAAALASANVGDPLNPALTTQQLWDEFYQIVRQPESDIESIITQQLMKFLYFPPAPGGLSGDGQVIFNAGGFLAGDAGLTYNQATNALTITGDLTVRTTGLVVNSSGLGVGISPSAWNSNYNAIDIGANGSIAGRLGASNTIDITSNAFRNSAGDWIYKIATSNPAARYQVDGSSGSHIWYSGTAGTAGNIIAGFSTAAMTLNPSGNLVFPSAKGIDFSAVTGGTGTATGNVLNDYEEGTWTGTLKGSGSDPTTPVTATGKYTKVGRQVSVQIAFETVSTAGASGDVAISGLPFANSSGIRTIGTGGAFLGATFSGTLITSISASASSIDYQGVISNAAWSAATHNTGTGRFFWTNITYTV